MKKATPERAAQATAKIQKNSLFIGIQPPKKQCSAIVLSTIVSKSIHKEYSLPIWGLPQDKQELVKEVAECKNAPLDYCVAALLGTVASIIRKGLQLTYNEYKNYPCFWLTLVGNSSRGKSPVLSWFWEPLEEWSKAVNSDYDKAVSDWQLQAQQGKRPPVKDFLVKDLTSEARNLTLKRNDEKGAAVLVQELGSFFGCFARYNSTATKDISDLNEIFDSSPIKIDRADLEKRLTVNEPFLNIIGGVQDDRLDKYYGNELMMYSGFIQRCMFVFPDNSPRSRNKKKISDEVRSGWRNYVSYLFSTFAKENVKTWSMTLSDEAAALFEEYSDKLADKEDAAENNYLVSLYSKQRYFVLRWAMIVAFLNLRDNYVISGQDMQYSIECMDYFEHCALKVYDLIRHPEKKPVLSNTDLIRLVNERFKLKAGCQNQLAKCFENMSQSLISMALSGKR
jgi:hypothetical protein